MFTLDEILKKEGYEKPSILRTKHLRTMRKCCPNVGKNHCIYNPCCVCINNERIKKEKGRMTDEEMCFQCQFLYVETD